MGIASKLDMHMSGSSILLWKINLLKQSLRVQMHAGWADFPHDIAEMMKNPGYREKIVKTDDLDALNSTLAGIRLGKSGKVVFRIASRDDLTHWCLLVGNAEDGPSDTICGSLICIDMDLITEERFGPVQSDPTAPIPQPGQKSGLSVRHFNALKRKLKSTATIHDQIALLCDWDQEGHFDSVLYSDVKQKKGRVEVYGAGEAFGALRQGASYPYEGTIAEMVVSLGLDHMLVEDTMESLKPIDWALFVPHGVRSYFAIPDFEAGVICGVLIFCSGQANHFSEDQTDYFRQVTEIFFARQGRRKA